MSEDEDDEALAILSGKICRRTLLSVLILWSTMIGVDPPPGPPGEGGAPTQLLPEAVAPKPAKARFPQGPLAKAPRAAIDRSLFLAAFKRQAPLALLPCLGEWRTVFFLNGTDTILPFYVNHWAIVLLTRVFHHDRDGD